MKYSVCVAVFGKSPYLFEQLNSILNQSLIPSQIVIVEDYSGISIKQDINNFLINKNIPFKIIVNEMNLGPAESFRKALLQTDHDFIFFSDQDDIWSYDKALHTIGHLESNFIVACNAKVEYEDGSKSHSLYKKEQFFNLSLLKMIHKNFLVGATLALNIKNHRNIINKLSFNPMHDWVLAVMSLLLNKKIKLINSDLMIYRRHKHTYTGRLKNSLVKKIKFRIYILFFVFNFIVQKLFTKIEKK